MMESNVSFEKAVVLDGNSIIGILESRMSDGVSAYPITPSSGASVGAQRYIANGTKNAWGREVAFRELESEHSSASSLEGFCMTGLRGANFTSSQGLILMNEVLNVISGKRLPAILHVGARALTSQGLNILAGHDDVMAVSQNGWGMLFAKNHQEIADYTLIARKAAEMSETPFMVIQDGFLLTHTVENLLLPTDELIREFITTQPKNYVDFNEPLTLGPVQNADSYMEGKIAQRLFTDKVAPNLKKVMKEYGELTGRNYGLIEGYGLDGAERILVSLGTVSETAMAVVDHLRSKEERVGVLNISSYRPFPAEEIRSALDSESIKHVSVIEKMDNPLAGNNPLTTEITAALYDAKNRPEIYSGMAGLGGKEVTAGMLIAAFDNMKDKGKKVFSLGINHETALESVKEPDLRPENSFSLYGISKGGWGSSTTNKVIGSLLAEVYDLNVQSFSSYGAEKKGAPLMYFTTVSPEKIRTHYQQDLFNFVCINDMQALKTSNPCDKLMENGVLFLQTKCKQYGYEEIWDKLPDNIQRSIYEKDIKVVAIDAEKYASNAAPTDELKQRMQGMVLAGVVLKHNPLRYKSKFELFEGIEGILDKTFGRKGKKIVEKNLELIKKGYNEGVEIPGYFIRNRMR